MLDDERAVERAVELVVSAIRDPPPDGLHHLADGSAQTLRSYETYNYMRLSSVPNEAFTHARPQKIPAAEALALT